MKKTTYNNIHDLISNLYQEELNNYTKYMNNNPDDKQRTRDYILTSAIYCKILHAIKEASLND